jgi:putative flippase GtrA
MTAVQKVVNKETVSYGIWGLITSAWNIGVFQQLFFLGIDYRTANVTALITTKIFAYIVNKKFVFKSHCSGKKELAAEIYRFIAARGFTMLIDFALLMALTDYLHVNPQAGKIVVTGIVIFLNYILSKLHVFKKEKHREIEV